MISRTIRAGVYRDLLFRIYQKSDDLHDYMQEVCAWLGKQQLEIRLALEEDLSQEGVNLYQYALNWFHHEESNNA